MVKCEILFDNNPQGVFYSGQQVAGKVKITLSKKKDVQAIILNLTGFAKTKWPEDNLSDGYKWFEGTEVYFNDTTFLVGLPGAEKTLTLEPRVHTFNFSHNLSPTLPSSFEGEYGNIKYLAKVTLKRPWKFDREYVVDFKVLKPVILNFEQPEIKLPFEIITSKELNSFNCSVGIRLPQMGFVPGQLMPVTLNIQNDSQCKVKNCKIKFNQIVTCKTQHDSNYFVYKKCLSKTKYGKVQGCTKKTILREIRVPLVPPNSKNSCTIITINYEIEAVLNFGLIHNKFSVCCPVLIGTNPVSSVNTYNDIYSNH